MLIVVSDGLDTHLTSLIELEIRLAEHRARATRQRICRQGRRIHARVRSTIAGYPDWSGAP